MAYTAPPTFASGDPLAASDLNILGDDIVYLKGIADGVALSGVDLTRAASTNISDSTNTDVTWTTEVADLGSWFSSGTDITTPSSAIPSGFTTIALLVHVRVLWAANGTGYRTFKLLQNGSAVFSPTVPGFSSDTAVIDSTTLLFGVAAGDVFKVQLYQNSGGTLAASSMHITIARFAPQA